MMPKSAVRTYHINIRILDMGKDELSKRLDKAAEDGLIAWWVNTPDAMFNPFGEIFVVESTPEKFERLLPRLGVA